MKQIEDKDDKFRLLNRELESYKKMMGKAGDIIRSQDISEYPIFIVHQQYVEIGIPIAEKDKVKGNWSVNASTLEELVSKSVIEESRYDDFIQIYKDPDQFLCLFTLSELGAQFIFIPR